MSGDDAGHGKHDVVIIKRHGGGHDEGGHGGAWKIAYADFMTAMMAFFLVMWLVNAANDDAKASIASYFNPMKLAEDVPAEKGLKKPVKGSKGEQAGERSKVEDDEDVPGSEAAEGRDRNASAGTETSHTEADLFENPYSVLAEIAEQTGQQANVSARGEGGAGDSGPASGADGGKAYRDPFDPDFWSRQVEVLRAGTDGKDTEAGTMPHQAGADAPPSPQQDAERLRDAIEQQLSGVAGKLAEGLTVTAAEGGLLVTLSDRSDDAMFNIGSAVPRREMVLAMERIGGLLKDRKGSILLRGHTDARPFKGGGNDNWGLSLSRARSAYHMLVRGGLAEARVKQVSGFADRRLQVPDDPMAPANRRIEILIEADEG